MKPCPDCGAAGPFPNGRRQCNTCYRAAERARQAVPTFESTGQTSAEIQQLIVANASEQQRVLDDIEPNKAKRIAALQATQKQLYAQRDAARRAERGQAPRESVGVQCKRAEATDVDRWAAVLKEAL